MEQDFIGKRVALGKRATLLVVKDYPNPTSLKKEELTCVPVWVKLHDVSIAAFTANGLRAIATKIDKPLMLDSFTSTMCNELWGRNSYAHSMIELSAENILKDSMVIAILNLKDEGYKYATITIEYE
ncbi:uncharacterized protein Tco_0029178 [Tanacetum coccineum]